MPALYDIVWSIVYPASIVATFFLGRALWRRCARHTRRQTMDK